MNDLPLAYWLAGLAVLLCFLLSLAAITHLLVALHRLRDLKEFWYQKYAEEHKVLEAYRKAARKGEFRA